MVFDSFKNGVLSLDIVKKFQRRTTLPACQNNFREEVLLLQAGGKESPGDFPARAYFKKTILYKSRI